MESIKDIGFHEFQFNPLPHPGSATGEGNNIKRPFQKASSTLGDAKSTKSPSSRDLQGKSDRSTSSSDDRKAPSDISQSSDYDPPREANSSDDVVWLYLTYNTPLPHSTERSKDSQITDNGDPEIPDLSPYTNPLEWSGKRKSALIWLSCVSTCFTAYAAGCYAPGADMMAAEWNISTVVALIGITVYTAGFAVAPMVLAPFSELQGRRPLFLVTGFLYFVFSLCCAFTRLYAGMIVSRFLAGCASSTFSTMVGGVVSDIYASEDRNTPMTLFTASAFFGTGLGPLVSGFLVQNLGDWRWIFYLHSAIVGVIVVALFLFFKETRGTVLLSRRATKLNEWYEKREIAGYVGFEMPVQGSEKKEIQRIRWKVKADEERATIAQMVKISLIRPFHLLVTEPVVFFFSLWISFAWSILYCTFSAIPFMYETVYKFSLQEATSVFSAISIASVITTFFSIAQDKWSRRGVTGSLPPERRLIFPCIGSVILTVALFWYGWTSNSSIHWIVPTLAVGFATMGIFSVYLAVFNYLADSYGRYASSAIAAQSFCRNLMAGAFPLFTEQMFDQLGFGPAGSMLGGIGAALTLVPYILLVFGPKIRARSKFASEILNES